MNLQGNNLRTRGPPRLVTNRSVYLNGALNAALQPFLRG